MEKGKTIDALNSLITINNDRIEGYNTASDGTDAHELKSLFRELSAHSQKCKQDLVIEVTKLGGEVAEGTKVTGKVFRAWMDVKAALTGNDRKAMLTSCEFGEDKAQETYDSVLQNERENLSAEQFSMVSQQKQLLKADHDRVKSMRDALVDA